jgi:hypothetical protein
LNLLWNEKRFLLLSFFLFLKKSYCGKLSQDYLHILWGPAQNVEPLAKKSLRISRGRQQNSQADGNPLKLSNPRGY